MVLVVLVITRPSSSKTNFVCVFYCVFGVGDFAGSSVWKVSLFHQFAQSSLLFFIFSHFLWKSLVVLFPTKLDSPRSEFPCKNYSVFKICCFPSTGSTGVLAGSADQTMEGSTTLSSGLSFSVLDTSRLNPEVVRKLLRKYRLVRYYLAVFW